MDERSLLVQAAALLERLGVEVREEHLGGGGGGLCVVRDRRIVLVDLDTDVPSRLERCLRALAACPELETQYIPPAIRERIERLSGRGF